MPMIAAVATLLAEFVVFIAILLVVKYLASKLSPALVRSHCRPRLLFFALVAFLAGSALRAIVNGSPPLRARSTLRIGVRAAAAPVLAAQLAASKARVEELEKINEKLSAELEERDAARTKELETTKSEWQPPAAVVSFSNQPVAGGLPNRGYQTSTVDKMLDGDAATSWNGHPDLFSIWYVIFDLGKDERGLLERLRFRSPEAGERNPAKLSVSACSGSTDDLIEGMLVGAANKGMDSDCQGVALGECSRNQDNVEYQSCSFTATSRRFIKV